MPDDKRSDSGEGATWVGSAPTRTAPPQERDAPPAPQPMAPSPGVRGSQYDQTDIVDRQADPDMEAPPGALPTPEDFRAAASMITGWLGGTFRAVRDRVWRPVSAAATKQWRQLRGQDLDRMVDSDTFDRQRAEDWERFRKGKTSSSYLQDDDR